MRRTAIWVSLVVASFGCFAAGVRAQVINEILTDNVSVEPRALDDFFVPIIELYNNTDETIVLGADNNDDSYGLTNLEVPNFRPDLFIWYFRPGTVIEPGEFLVIFGDGNVIANLCEPHTNFELKVDGSQPLELWGPQPKDPRSSRPILDRVHYPPLLPNVSFGRYPDGAGPAPVPLEDTFEHFFHFPS
ncbi:MAG: hypothetical protein AAF517_06110, partial [Planctomycetota bacterium]